MEAAGTLGSADGVVAAGTAAGIAAASGPAAGRDVVVASVGDLVRLFTFRQGNANLVEMTLPAESPYVGTPAGLVPFPDNCALVTILRDGQVYPPSNDQPLESGDELLFVVPAEIEDALQALLSPRG